VYTSVAEALRSENDKVTGAIASGCVVGALFGLLLSLAYQQQTSLYQQLHRAIRKDKVDVHYQPIVDLETGAVVGAEALARWTDDDGFSVPPDVFVKIAEDRGFINALTKVVVTRALRDFAGVLRARPDFRLNVNVTANDLSDPHFLPMLAGALRETEVAAASLAIEITESCTARKQVAIQTIRELRRRGHGVHIDDFGTGYSSLAYLNELSVDTIKIDRAFTQTIGTEAVTVGILPQILEMADVLHLQIIVEGIETPEQASYFIAGDRPVLAQGWLFGFPVSAAEFLRAMADVEERKMERIDAV
jgi:sensor c-di-GMP phosphodiesterase-like protein